MMKTTMLFGQKFLLYCILLLVLVEASGAEEFPGDRFKIHVKLVDTKDDAPAAAKSYQLQEETPVFENEETKKLDLMLYIDPSSSQERAQERTTCICMKTNAGLENQDTPTKDCSGYSRICFNKDRCFGKDEEPIKFCTPDRQNIHGKAYDYYHIIVEGSKAIVSDDDEHNLELDIAQFSLFAPSGRHLQNLGIGLITFYENVNSADCTDENDANCLHKDVLFLKTRDNPAIQPPTDATTAATSEQSSTTNETSTSPTSPSLSTSTTEETATGSLTAIYVCIGVVVAIVILLILLCVLRCCQGVWCCGICCFRKEQSEDENNRKRNYKFTRSDEDDKKGGGGDKGNEQKEPQIIQGQTTDEINRSKEMKITFEGRPMLDRTQPSQTTTEEQQNKLKQQELQKKAAAALANEKKKYEKGSQSSSSSAAADAKENKEKDKPGKRRAQAPNMLLVATREEDTQSEGEKIPSKRKTKVDKNNKEPAATKNVTQDPGAAGTTTGKAAAKTGGKNTEAQTGIPKSQTDLATDKDGPAAAATKGVSATQADKVTENYETRTTQRGTTMATGAAKATTLPTTQLGTQTTQGGGATTAAAAGGKTKTGIGKTAPRVTGPTQMPSSEDNTNETQLPTGATKTKPTQLQTGATKNTKATQLATGATQKVSIGTTQAGTGTTQRGTTMATGKTQIGTTAATQAQTGTRQTGETQNPDDTDIDYTQVGETAGASRGGTRPTQLPSDADADPTQNPTAFTGGKTSKTQLAATGTKTRTTQKQTKKTDAL